MTEQDFRDGFNSSQDETWLAVYADWLEENGRPDEARHVRKAKAGGGGGGDGGGGSGGGGGGGGGGDGGDGGGGSGGGGDGGDGDGDGGGGGGSGGGSGGGGDGGGGSGGGIIQGELRMFSVGERLLVIVRSGYNPAAYVGTVTKVFNGGLGVVLDGVMCNWCPGGDWQGLARGDKALRAKGGAQYRAHGGAVRLPEIARAHDWVGDLPEWK